MKQFHCVKYLLSAACCILAWGFTFAEQRLELMAGHQTTRCTYLSPLTYTGPGYGLHYEWRRQAWRESTEGIEAKADFNYGYLLRPAKNS